LLDANLFMHLDDVRETAYWWQIDYNKQRPHHALGGIPPVAYRIKNAENSTNEPTA
jgi:putative transposase